MFKIFKKLSLIGLLPISHEGLIILGYKYHTCKYYCPPGYDCGIYRLELQATAFEGNKPIIGTEKWRAYLTNNDLSTIKRFKNFSELNYFHRGMVGKWLF